MFDLLVGVFIFVLCYLVTHVVGNSIAETREMDSRARFVMQLVMAMAATSVSAVVVKAVWHG